MSDINILSGKSLWCPVCQHGVIGRENEQCPICISEKYRGESAGILVTPEQHEKNIKERGRAVKLARKDKVLKGYKTIEESEKEITEKVLKRIQENFDLVPKTKEQPKITAKASEVPKTSVSSGTIKTLKGDK